MPTSQDTSSDDHSHEYKILSNISDAVFILDREWRYEFINQAAAELFKKPIDELKGKVIWDCSPEIVNTPLQRLYQLAMDTGEPQKLDIQNLIAGKWYKVQMYPNEAGITVCYVDNTEHKKLEQSLKEANMDLQKAQEIGKIGYWQFDVRQGKITSWSETTYEMYEREVADGPPTYEELLAYCDDETSDLLAESLKKAIHGIPYNIEYRVNINGKVKNINAIGYPIFDELNQDQVIKLHGIVQDVSEFKYLRDSNYTYKKLFENLHEEVHIWKLVRDEEGKIIDWVLVDANPMTLRNWNMNKDQVLGMSVNAIFDYDAVNQFLPTINSMFQKREPHFWEQYFPPTKQILQMTSIPFDEMYISTGRDITDYKEYENGLKLAKQNAEEISRLKTEQMSLANKIADRERNRISQTLHDGIVQELVGLTMLLNHSGKITKDPSTVNLINELKHTINRITIDVRDVSHQIQDSDVKGSNLTELFARLEKQYILYKDIQFSFVASLSNQANELSEIVVTHIYRIVQELISNIIKHSHAKHAKITLEEIGDEIHLNVSDDGVGMDSGGNVDGIGLKNIMNRVDAINGSFAYTTDNGWHIDIVVPLD